MHTGIQAYRHTGIQAYRHTGMRAYGHTGIRTYGHTVSKVAGLLAAGDFAAANGEWSKVKSQAEANVVKMMERGNMKMGGALTAVIVLAGAKIDEIAALQQEAEARVRMDAVMAGRRSADLFAEGGLFSDAKWAGVRSVGLQGVRQDINAAIDAALNNTTHSVASNMGALENALASIASENHDQWDSAMLILQVAMARGMSAEQYKNFSQSMVGLSFAADEYQAEMDSSIEEQLRVEAGQAEAERARTDDGSDLSSAAGGNIAGPEVTADQALENAWRGAIESNSEKVREANQDAIKTVASTVKGLLAQKGELIRLALETRGVSQAEITAVFAALESLAEAENGGQAVKWFQARVEGPEKYMLGHENALAVNIIEYLSERQGEKGDLLAEYILHEAMEMTKLGHVDIIKITSGVFSRGEFKTPGQTQLGIALRDFIDLMAASGKTEVAAEVTAASIDADVGQREAVDIEAGQSIPNKTDNVNAVAAYEYSDEDIDSMDREREIKKINRSFNTAVKKKFGSTKDNQQMRLFRMVKGDEIETMKGLLSELNRGVNKLKKTNDRLVGFMPAFVDLEMEEGESIKDALASWVERNADQLALKDLAATLDMLANPNVTIIRDSYTDGRFPDLGMRFILARHVASFERQGAEGNVAGQKKAQRNIVELLVNATLDDDIKKQLQEAMKQEDVTAFLSQLIIQVDAIDYNDIEAFAEMVNAVAVSL